MKLTSIKNDFFTLCSFDNELLINKNRRPYVLVLKLKYKEQNIDFAIPFRSNIPPGTSKHLYFSLPPRSQTKHNHSHGLHYIKMFPITKIYLEKYHFSTAPQDQRIYNILQTKTHDIVNGAQTYLQDYESGNRPPYSTNIDGILAVLKSMS